MMLDTYQESRLRDLGEQQGDYTPLMHFYAVQRRFTELSELKRRLPDQSVPSRLAYELLNTAARRETPPDLTEAVIAEEDPWFAYTYVKHLLRRNALRQALEVVQACLARGPEHLPSLNLLIRFTARQAPELTSKFIDASLQISGVQQDIGQLRLLGAGKRDRSQLVLDPLPQDFQVGYYVPVYNAEAALRQCLESIFTQSHPLTAVMIVDDGSRDGSIAQIGDLPVQVVAHETNRGLATARNSAFERLTTTFVAGVDSDVCLDPHYLRNILMEFENNDPRAVGVGGRLIEVHQENPADRWRAAHLSQLLGPVRRCPPDMLPGSNTVYLREEVVHAGGFDPARKTNAEDADLCRRLLERGKLFTYAPHAVAWHTRSDTAPSVLQTAWRWHYWARRQAGVFSSNAQLIGNVAALVGSGRQSMESDAAANAADLIPLDVAYPFAMLVQDAAHAIDENLLTPQEAAAFWAAARGVLLTLDERFRGEGAAKLVKLLRRLPRPLHAPPPNCALRASVVENINKAAETLTAFCDGLSAGRYRLVDWWARNQKL